MTDINTGPPSLDIDTVGTTIRRVTIVLLLVVAALYALVLAVQLPHLRETDNPAPVYGFLAVVYLASAALYTWHDTTRVAWGLAAVQATVLALFAWSVWLVYREGDEQFILDMLGLAVSTTLTQVVVLALLVVRARRRPAG